MNNKEAQCAMCGRTYKKYRNNQLYCSRICCGKSDRIKNGYEHPLEHLTKGKMGSISELEVCTHYLKEGYEVFRNVSQDGLVDIVIWKKETNEIHLIDVKTYLTKTDPQNYIKQIEEKNDFDVKVVPYNYMSREVLREL